MRIGIDIDDTLTDIREEVIKQAFIYAEKLGKDIASIKFLSRSIFRYFSIFVIFIFSFIILLAANLKKKIKDGTKKWN